MQLAIITFLLVSIVFAAATPPAGYFGWGDTDLAKDTIDEDVPAFLG